MIVLGDSTTRFSGTPTQLTALDWRPLPGIECRYSTGFRLPTYERAGGGPIADIAASAGPEAAELVEPSLEEGYLIAGDQPVTLGA